MRLETLPVILGILFAIVGLALVADAAIPDGALLRPERRRSARPQRHLAGEAALGSGIVCVGVGLIGGDGWPYTTVAFLLALILCTVGVVLNWRYVRGMMLVDTGLAPDAPTRPAPSPEPRAAAGATPATPPAPSTAAPSRAAAAQGSASEGRPAPEHRTHAG